MDLATSAWAVILASSLVLAAISGLFYFVGGAIQIGRSRALGLYFLTNLQPAEYIFAGANYLIQFFAAIVPPLLSTLIVAAVAFSVPYLPRLRGRIAADWEPRLFGIASTLSWLIVVAIYLKTDASATDIWTAKIPLVATHAQQLVWDGFLAVTAITVIAFSVLLSRALRLYSLISGGLLFSLSLYNMGLTAGAAELYNPFSVVTLTSVSGVFSPDTRALVLGSDEKTLVVLMPSAKGKVDRSPTYIPRSDIKIFRIVGTETINKFILGQHAQPGSKAGFI